MASKKTATALAEPTNGATLEIEDGQPIIAEIEIEGVAGLLFHRWDCDAVNEKAKAKKGSKTKNEDNVESYLYREDDDDKSSRICLPGEYFRQSLIRAAKQFRDPGSARASLESKAKAGLVIQDVLAPLFRLDDSGEPDFIAGNDYALDRRRATIPATRSAITRVRPFIAEGWRARFQVISILPEYIGINMLHELAIGAGRFVGVADFRPTFGRFRVVKCDALKME